MSDIITDQNKLLQYLFLNLAYLLRESKATIKFENPQYGDASFGFAITMFRLDHKAYDYAEECFRLIGKDPVRECGVTMSVSFDTPEENDAFRDNFKLMMDQAEEQLAVLGDRNVQEYYFLKCAPVLMGIEDTPNNHFVFLLADVLDDLDMQVLGEVLGDHDISGDFGTMEIKVICYRKKWRDRLVRYLGNLGVKSRI